MAFDIKQFEPLPPTEGPPLPQILDPYLPWHGYWPWYKQSSTTGTLSGTVTDESAGSAISGVLVTLEGEGSTSGVVTDSSGNYSFTDIIPGNYTITFTKDGYETVAK